MLADVKKILGLTDKKSDAVLCLMIKDTEQAVLDYCHLRKLPAGLVPVVRGMVVGHFIALAEGNIASVKRGDTQVSYREPVSTGTFTEKQIKQLNAYRRLKVR